MSRRPHTADDAAGSGRLPTDPAGPVTPSGPAATVTPAPAAPPRRVSRRAQRRQERRRRVTVVAAVAVLVVLAGVAAVWKLSSSAPAPPSRTAGGAAAASTGSAVLLALVADDGTATGAALLGHDAGRDRSALVMVPTTLLVDVPGAGSQPLSTAVALPSPDGAAKAVDDLLGLRVAGSWRLTAAGLARLVDAAGGIDVTVDREVVRTQPGGTKVVVVPQGRQHLDGAGAAAFATYLADGEPEQARAARLSTVLQALLGTLPSTRDGVAALLSGLGNGSRTTVDDLAARLVQLRADAAAGQVDYDVLPTKVLETGTAQESLSLDADAAASQLRRLLPDALRSPLGVSPVRVLVQNGVGTPGLGEPARDKLVAAGFAYVSGGNAAQLGHQQTLVLVADGTKASRDLGARVAAALGVGADAVRITSSQQSLADVVVILGADFRP